MSMESKITPFKRFLRGKREFRKKKKIFKAEISLERSLFSRQGKGTEKTGCYGVSKETEKGEGQITPSGKRGKSRERVKKKRATR